MGIRKEIMAKRTIIKFAASLLRTKTGSRPFHCRIVFNRIGAGLSNLLKAISPESSASSCAGQPFHLFGSD
jgi:hypothetical protein